MSKGYSVPIQNRFAQLDSEAEDEVPVTKSPAVTEPAPTKRERPARVAAKEDSRPQRRPFDRDAPPRDGARGGFRGRGGRGGFRDERPNEDDTVANDETRQRRPRTEGQRGGRGGAFRGGREFDRHSGTGRGKEMKKSGGGGHNWGAEGETPTNEVPVTADGEVANEEAPVEVDGAQTPEAEKAKSESDNGVDYSEWKKEQKLKRDQLMQETLRNAPARAVDAADLEKEGYQRYEREETEEERVARELRAQQQAEESDSEVDESRPKTINVYDFTGSFGRRGGRRGGRGGAAVDRSSPQRPAALDLQDATSFPSLG